MPGRVTRGPVPFQITHGETRGGNTPEYKAWIDMRTRCYRANHVDFPNYGARGIRVCARWRRDFPAFLADVGRKPSPRHSLDRIDNNRHYEPGNIRWATVREQNRNRRNNVFLTAFGRTQCLTDWAAECRMSLTTIRSRMKRGWSVERALTAPLRGARAS
jgi:hypothetical protein